MSTPSTTASPRLLTPTTEYFRRDGEPFFRLSPHKGLKNASIIYNSIKNLPDKTIVRGDFDKKSKPIIFFPERAKKKIGQLGNINTIKAGDVDAGRKEMAGFLSSIAIEGIQPRESGNSLLSTALMLNQTIALTQSDQRDFTVGDIKKPLHILANAYILDEVRKKTSPHRLLGRQVTKIQNQRLRDFVAISRETADDIYTALRVGRLKNYDLRPETGLFAIKVMVKQFLSQESLSSKSFASFVRQNAHDIDIQFFAQHWHAISQPMPSDERMQFSTQPWAKELDRLCEIVLKANRRSTRFMKLETAEGGEAVSQLVLPSSASKQLQKLPLPDKVEYSSLKSEDTDESSSFPSPPFIQNQHSDQELGSFNPAFPSQPSAGLSNESELEEGYGEQSRLSTRAVDKAPTEDANKIVYQSLATSSGSLALQKSNENYHEEELGLLLKPVAEESYSAEESDFLVESSNREEKTEITQG